MGKGEGSSRAGLFKTSEARGGKRGIVGGAGGLRFPALGEREVAGAVEGEG